MNWYSFFVRKVHGDPMHRVSVHAIDTHDATIKLCREVKPLVYWDFCTSQSDVNEYCSNGEILGQVT